MGKDQFGDGGSRRIPKSKIAKAKKKGCGCSYAEAGKAITRLEFRLATRYVRMDVKARLGLLA